MFLLLGGFIFPIFSLYRAVNIVALLGAYDDCFFLWLTGQPQGQDLDA